MLDPALAAALNKRELRTVWLMFAGLEYQEALTAAGYAKRAAVRDKAPPQRIRTAVDYLLTDMTERCGLSRKWILTNVVALYRRAAQAEPVRDSRGRETGVYRFDGATAARCLEMLGNQAGMFGKKVTLDVPNDVRQLMQAIASRGRPTLAAPEPRVIGHGSAATPQTGETPRRNVSEGAQAAVAPTLVQRSIGQ